MTGFEPAATTHPELLRDLAKNGEVLPGLSRRAAVRRLSRRECLNTIREGLSVEPGFDSAGADLFMVPRSSASTKFWRGNPSRRQLPPLQSNR